MSTTVSDAGLGDRLLSEDDERSDVESNVENDALQAGGGSLTPFLESPSVFFRERFQAGSIKGSVFTLLVAIVGAGTLSVPLAFEKSGVLLGLLMFALGGYLAFFSLELLVISCEISGVKSYTGIAKKLYGPKLCYFAQACLLCNLYGTAISYTVAAGSLLSQVLQVITGETDPTSMSWYIKPKFIILAATFFLVIPLGLLRTMGALRYSSLVAVFCTSYLSLVVTIKYFTYCTSDTLVSIKDVNETVQCFWNERKEGQTAISLAKFSVDNMLQAIPIVVYAYTCHPNVLPVFLELQKPTQRRMGKVVWRAVFVSFVMYSLIGSFGYLTFKDQLELSNGNFLSNDYHHDAATLLGAMGMSLSVVLALPLFVNAFRGNFYKLVRGERADAKLAPASWHYGMSLGLISAAAIPAVLVEDISKVFQVLGSTTNPAICFVLPCLFILKAPDGAYRFEKVASVVVAVVISLISVASLVQNMRSWGRSSSGESSS